MPHFSTNSVDSYLISYIQDFLPKLKRHLFPRITKALIQEVEANPECYPAACLPMLEASSSSEPTERDLDAIYFHSDTIYRHNILQVLYTTYDCLQDVNTINPKTLRRDIMCLAAREVPEEGAPNSETTPVGYVYGRILGIFHANIVYGGSGALDYRRRRFDFLWVRRYTTPLTSRDERDPWISKRLDRLKLVSMLDRSSYDFLDPSEVLRGAHIIPRFSMGPLYDGED